MSVGFIYSSCPQHPLLQAVSTLLRGSGSLFDGPRSRFRRGILVEGGADYYRFCLL